MDLLYEEQKEVSVKNNVDKNVNRDISAPVALKNQSDILQLCYWARETPVWSSCVKSAGNKRAAHAVFVFSGKTNKEEATLS